MRGLIDLIDSVVIPKANPAVYLSGGIDSTIILYHLRKKFGGKIYTYTAKFGPEDKQCEQAEKVAKHFNTTHTTLEIVNFIDRLPEILKHFDRPRYNVWIYFLAEQAKKDGRQTIYAGEGADEHFGGYGCDYLTGWANHIAYIQPTYEYIHNTFSLYLELPFTKLDWQKTFRRYYRSWCPLDKASLRIAYENILPEYVIKNKKKPPDFCNWRRLWEYELSKHFPNFKPKDDSDIRMALQYEVAKAWINSKQHILLG